MHKIDNHWWNHNSLSEGDVNRNGYTDYAIVHEGPNKFTFILHPGKDGNPKVPWRKVIVGRSQRKPEYSCFGDFDGDGFLDIVGIVELDRGAKIFWGPETSRVTDPEAWEDGGAFKQTQNRGHFLWVKAKDINRDGAPDIVMSGRVQGSHGQENIEGKPTAGIVWLEAPAKKRDRRDLSKWRIHDIDSKTKGGRGFEFSDVDGDGDEDIVNCSADWNTPVSEVRVVWYENPGSASPAQKKGMAGAHNRRGKWQGRRVRLYEDPCRHR